MLKISAEETGGIFIVVEHSIDPGMLVRPHMHTREDKFPFVLEGEIGVLIGDQIFEAKQGSYVWKPRLPHTIWNPGPKPARLIKFVTSWDRKFYYGLAEILKTSRRSLLNLWAAGALWSRGCWAGSRS